MKSFPVERLYLVDDVRQDERAMRRAVRLSNSLGVAEPIVISRGEATELHAKSPAKRPNPFVRRTGGFDYSRGWTVILDSFVDEGSAGVTRTTFRRGEAQMEGKGVCRSALEIHGAHGCLHRCAYCHCDPHFVIACDLESLAERLPEYFDAHPQQKLYKFDNLTDTIALEPEYGASEILVPLFAATDDKHLLLYTKSDNVEHLLDLDHRGRTIVNWSLSPPAQSRLVEIGAPDTEARIRAMTRCALSGYPVRARISPLVPLRGWREGVTELIDLLFGSASPDSVTIDVVGWCKPEALAEAIDVSLLEDAHRRYIADAMGEGNAAEEKFLFGHEMRREMLLHAAREVKRRSPGTPVALCNETREMWRDLAGVLEADPQNYVCCCGPDCVGTL